MKCFSSVLPAKCRRREKEHDMSSNQNPDLLIFEPQIAGHRLTWLQYVTEDFLQGGFSVAWAVDLRTESKRVIQERLTPRFNGISMISVFDDQNTWRGGSKINSIAECLKISRAKYVFVNELDEVASNVLRKAAVGIFPPANLKGNLSGVYFRPRFLSDPLWPPGNVIKASGFRRLIEQQWFRHIYLVDEYLISSASMNYAGNFHFLPDPWAGDYLCSLPVARQSINIPAEKFVFLHYGIGDRRKGLHLAVAAVERTAPDSRIFLLCAGQNLERSLLKRIEGLEKRGKAKLLNRYISDEEERIIFCAADAVLLPYIHHYGSSGVLSRAAAAGRMVIASDEGLLARRVREHDLGLLFPTNNINALHECMMAASALDEERRTQLQQKLLHYAKTCSRENFRQALLAPWHAKNGQT